MLLLKQILHLLSFIFLCKLNVSYVDIIYDDFVAICASNFVSKTEWVRFHAVGMDGCSNPIQTVFIFCDITNFRDKPLM